MKHFNCLSRTGLVLTPKFGVTALHVNSANRVLPLPQLFEFFVSGREGPEMKYCSNDEFKLPKVIRSVENKLDFALFTNGIRQNRGFLAKYFSGKWVTVRHVVSWAGYG